MAEGAERSRRREHRYYVGWKQERLETSTCGPNGRGEGLCRHVEPFVCFFLLYIYLFLLSAAENDLSFIETSALDASNVESAFQTILAGASHRFIAKTILLRFFQTSTELSPANPWSSRQNRSGPRPGIRLQ